MDLYEMPLSSIIFTSLSERPSTVTLKPQPRKSVPGVLFTSAFSPYRSNTDLALFAWVTEAKAMMCLFTQITSFRRSFMLRLVYYIRAGGFVLLYEKPPLRTGKGGL